MPDETWLLLEAEFAEMPILRAESVPFDDIDTASAEIGIPFPADYRTFLHRYGGAIVGPYPILGVRKAKAMSQSVWSITAVNEKFRAKHWPGIDDWLIISVDLGGNPMGFAVDERIYVSDHEFRQIAKIADDFEDFIRNYCLQR